MADRSPDNALGSSEETAPTATPGVFRHPFKWVNPMKPRPTTATFMTVAIVPVCGVAWMFARATGIADLQIGFVRPTLRPSATCCGLRIRDAHPGMRERPFRPPRQLRRNCGYRCASVKAGEPAAPAPGATALSCHHAPNRADLEIGVPRTHGYAPNVPPARPGSRISSWRV
jgi:hypothetical protein